MSLFHDYPSIRYGKYSAEGFAECTSLLLPMELIPLSFESDCTGVTQYGAAFREYAFPRSGDDNYDSDSTVPCKGKGCTSCFTLSNNCMINHMDKENLQTPIATARSVMEIHGRTDGPIFNSESINDNFVEVTGMHDNISLDKNIDNSDSDCQDSQVSEEDTTDGTDNTDNTDVDGYSLDDYGLATYALKFKKATPENSYPGTDREIHWIRFVVYTSRVVFQLPVPVEPSLNITDFIEVVASGGTVEVTFVTKTLL